MLARDVDWFKREEEVAEMDDCWLCDSYWACSGLFNNPDIHREIYPSVVVGFDQAMLC